MTALYISYLNRLDIEALALTDDEAQAYGAQLADMHRRLQQPDEARRAYRRALALTRQPADRRFLQKRLDELPAVDEPD